MRTPYCYLPLATVLLLAACASAPAIDPLGIKLNDIDQRLGRVEAVVSNQSLVDLSRRVDALEAQLRSLRGSVEESQNGGAQLGKQQRDLYADLSKRLAALEAANQAAAGGAMPMSSTPGASLPASGGYSSGTGSAPGGGASAAAAGSSSGQADYERALTALRAGKYAETIGTLKNFSADHPGSAIADNAQYWLGEAYYVTGDYPRAAATFRSVGERWPQSRKVPDAQLKLGFTQQLLQDPKAARATLQQVIIRYPDSDAAKLARDRLLQMSAENR
jgi:tol-pal system protein YbgF